MADSRIENIIEQESQMVTGKSPENEPTDQQISLHAWLIHANSIVPPWWSPARDRSLLEFVRECNHLAIAVYNAVTKISGMPFRIVANDSSDPLDVDLAENLTYQFQSSTDFGAGWQHTFGKFLFDVLVLDNGGFMEVIGDGEPDGPIIGPALSLVYRDSFRCQRTRSSKYPVLYTDTDGSIYKMHRTRVISLSQLPSGKTEMNNVGFSAVSRSILVAQNLLDIYLHKQEMLGSRPRNQMLVGRGVTGTEIMNAMRMVDEELDNMGLRRYSKTVAIGSKNTQIGVDKIDLTSMTPYDEQTSVDLGIYAIAAAFGMDADELWPIRGRGAGAGDADLRRWRTKGRLPAQITAEVVRQMGYKVLPRGFSWIFDYRDDDEDQQRALVRDIRARNRQRDLDSKSSSQRIIRAQMLEDGEITQEQHEAMEMADGFLPDGNPITLLAYTKDPVYQRYLKFSSDPCLFHSNDPSTMIVDIEKNRSGALSELAETSSDSKRRKLRRALFALDWFEKKYTERLEEIRESEPEEPEREEDEPIDEEGPADTGGQLWQ